MKIHKCLKQFLGIILLLASGNNHIYAQTNSEEAKINNIKTVAPSQTDRYAILTQNPSWRKIKMLWESMLNISNNPTFKEYKNNNNEFKKAFEALREKYSSEADSFSYHLRALYRKKLISEEEKQFLSRLYYLRYDSFLPLACFTCYLAASNPSSPMLDLGQRLEILKKLFKENKINQDTYNKTIKEIKRDLTLIDFKRPYGSLLIDHYNTYLMDTYNANIKDNSVSYDDFIKNNSDKIITYEDYIHFKFPEENANKNINLLIYLMK